MKEEATIRKIQIVQQKGELTRKATTEKISVIQRKGNRDFNRELWFFNKDRKAEYLESLISTRENDNNT